MSPIGYNMKERIWNTKVTSQLSAMLIYLIGADASMQAVQIKSSKEINGRLTYCDKLISKDEESCHLELSCIERGIAINARRRDHIWID